MDSLFFILSGISLAIGVVALLIGSLGLLRLPDVYSRIHAVGMIDTAGAGFILLGMLFYAGFSIASVKLAAIGIFLFFTSPIATDAVALVAHQNGVDPTPGTKLSIKPTKGATRKPKAKAAKTAKASPKAKAKASVKASVKAKAKTKAKASGKGKSSS